MVRGTRLPADGGVRGRDVLGSDEIKKISSSNAANAYEVVKRLRPEFLTQRTLSVTGDRVLGPALRINEGSVPDIDVLRTIPARDLIEVRFVRPLDAVHRFGAMFGAGLLLVRTAP